MGYMIIRRTQKGTSFLGWAEDDNTLAKVMAELIERGITTEILEYVPDINPRTDPNLIPQLNLWRDHLEGEEHVGQRQP